MSAVLNIKENLINNVQILEIEGRLDGSTSNQLQDRIDGLTAAGFIKFVFDLGALSYISSAGLRVFLATDKELAAKNGKFVLCCLRGKVKEVFDIVGFTFENFGSRQDALNSFTK